MRVDVAVIGAGIQGSSVALRLAQAGAKVAVLERGIPGVERGGRNSVTGRGGGRARALLRAVPRLPRALPFVRPRGRVALRHVDRLPPARHPRGRARRDAREGARGARGEDAPAWAPGGGPRRERGPPARARDLSL